MVHWENGISPSERFEALLRGEKLDRIPINPWVQGHAAKIMGYKTLGEYYEYPKVWIKCMETAMEMYQFCPSILPMSIGPLWIGAWGSKFMYPYEPKMGSVTLIEPAVKKPEDVEKLEVPDPAPYIGPQYESIELAQERDLLPLVMIPGGPISAAAYSITEPETFMFWIIKEPDLCHKILDLSAEYGIRVAELYVKKFGPESWIPLDGGGGPTDANVLISPDTYAKFPMPRAIKVRKKLLEMGVPTIYTHWCADHNKNIEAGHVDTLARLQGDPGILFFGPEVPMELQVERWGKQHILIGNVDPPAFMYESFDEVLERCRKNIEVGMKAERGYMLGCGCEFPPPSPPANAFALTKAAREYGKYR